MRIDHIQKKIVYSNTNMALFLSHLYRKYHISYHYYYGHKFNSTSHSHHTYTDIKSYISKKKHEKNINT